jgi:hypothetical protein
VASGGVKFEKKLKSLQNFRKIKKRWKLSKERTKPKIFEKFHFQNFLKNIKNFGFCALFRQFPAFFDFSKNFGKKIQKTLEIVQKAHKTENF